MLCDASFGRGITFTPTTYSSGGAAGIAGGPLAYRSPNKQVIVAIPGDARANPMFFEIAGPNRIVWGNTCALVRAGSPAANAAANAATRRVPRGGAAVNPSAPRPGCRKWPLWRLHGSVNAVAPAPEAVAKHLDKLGVVGRKPGVPCRRAIQDPPSKANVPNSTNLRIALRRRAWKTRVKAKSTLRRE